MRDEASGVCARCTDPIDNQPERFRPHFEWVQYLKENRGMDTPENVVVFPLCDTCATRFLDLKHQYQDSKMRGPGHPDELLNAIFTELDQITLSEIVDG